MFLSPLYHNAFVAILTVAYVKTVISITDFLILDRVISPDTSRKIVHMAAASWMLFWPLFEPSHWSWRFNVLVPVVFAVRLFVKGAIIRDANDEDVRSMSRSGSPTELLYGPLQFTLVMTWIGLTRFMTAEACVLMAALGFGDGLAPLVGARHGRHRYRLPFGAVKTLEGSLTVAVGTVLGCHVFFYGSGLPIPSMKDLVTYGGAAAVIEACAPNSFDNLVLPWGMMYCHAWVERRS